MKKQLAVHEFVTAVSHNTLPFGGPQRIRNRGSPAGRCAASRIARAGATPDVVIEEIAGSWIKTAMDSGRIAQADAVARITALNSQLPADAQMTVGNDAQAVTEAFSRLVQAYARGIVSDKAVATNLPARVVAFLRSMIQAMKAVFARAQAMMQIKAAGKLDEEIEGWMRQTLALDTPDAREAQAEQEGFADAATEIVGETFSTTPTNSGVSSEEEAAAMADAEKAFESLTPEAQRRLQQVAAMQMASIRNLYKGTPGWMKAPNGQPTNLNEHQWLQVRTSLFKQRFGDWEAAKSRAFLESDPIATLTGEEFQKAPGESI